MVQASAEKVEHTEATKKWPQSHREREVGKYAGAAFANRKRNRAVSPEYQIVRGERVKVIESRTLAKEGGSEREHGEKRVDSKVKEDRF